MDESTPTPDGDSELERFLVKLGSELLASGESAQSVVESLRAVGSAAGSERTEVLVFPRALLVETDEASGRRVELAIMEPRDQRFDRDLAVHDLAVRAQRAEISPSDGCREIDEIRAMPPRYRLVVRVFGGAVLAVGVALMLQPTAMTVVLAAALGVLVAGLQEIAVPELQVILPTLTAFVAGLIVFGFADAIGSANPIRVLVAPLIMLMPGLMILTSTIELASGEMVVGAGRFIAGLMQVLLLAVGIVAAANLIGIGDQTLIDQPVARFGPWAPVLGLFVLNLGFRLRWGTPARIMPLIAVVQLVAYGTEVAASASFSPEMSGFFGAVVMTPLAMLIARRFGGLPTMVLLIPGLWVLLPGAAGLIGLAGLVEGSTQVAGDVLMTTLTTVVSIGLGVLVGSSVIRTGERVVRG